MSDMRHELQVTDADVFENLRGEVEGLASCREAWEGGDTPAARAALVDHFMDRREPAWPFDWRGLDGPVTETSDQANVSAETRARALLDDVIVDSKAQRTSIRDFDNIPKRMFNYGSPFMFELMNHTWCLTFAQAWARTRDERYAEKLVEYLRVMRERCPLIVTSPEPRPGFFAPDSQLKWPIMCIGKTARAFLDALYTGVLSSPAFSTDDRFLFIKTLWFYAFQHTWYTGKLPFAHANHHFFEVGMMPFILGVALPEFKGFPEMREAGARCMNEHVRRDFMPSGAYIEHSTAYTIYSMNMYFTPWQIARINGLPLFDAESAQVIEKWMGWLVDIVRPDGFAPLVGDGHEFAPIAALENAAALCGSAEAKALREALWEAPPRLPGALREDYEACGESMPERQSVVYEDKGWIILRDGWLGDEASHFVMSAPRPPFNHGHWDMGSFVLYARGRPFIGDPAGEIYNGYHDAERRGYLYSMGAHNVLTVDDDELISKRALYPIWTGKPPTCVIAGWRMGDDADFVTIYHDGYSREGFLPNRHVREVLFRKHAYWVILDHLTEGGPAGWIHTIRRFAHFCFGVSARVHDGVVTAANEGEALTIVPSEAADTEMIVSKDCMLEPERERFGADELPDVLELRHKTPRPAVMAFLIYPHSADEAPRLSVEVLDPCAPARIRIETPLGIDVWETYTLTNPDGPAEAGSGRIVNTLTASGEAIAMPAQWTERTRFEVPGDARHG